MPARLASLVAAVVALCVAGCGGGDARKQTSSAPKRVDAASAAVIRGWVDAARSGDMGRAAGYFALPTVVENGGEPLALTTRAQVVAFNRALPCGARLVRTILRSGYTVATFRLTSRPGGDCQGGEGELAYTAFKLRGGKISAWIRVDSERPPVAQPPRGAPAAPSPPSVSA